jgi:hypothetical protein
MLELLNNIKIFGWIYLLAYFIPVYWRQDTKYENNGFEILSFNPKNCYFKGTISQRDKEFNYPSIDK